MSSPPPVSAASAPVLSTSTSVCRVVSSYSRRMVRHVVLFGWKPGTTDEMIAEIEAALAELPAAVGTIAEYRFGPDIGENETSIDFAVVADFATLDDYRTYRDHPRHQSLIRELIAPVVETRCAVQYHLDAATGI